MQTNIAAIRSSKNLSQEELAKKAGVSRVIISQLENNKRAVITTDTMFKISRALETPVEDILWFKS